MLTSILRLGLSTNMTEVFTSAVRERFPQILEHSNNALNVRRAAIEKMAVLQQMSVHGRSQLSLLRVFQLWEENNRLLELLHITADAYDNVMQSLLQNENSEWDNAVNIKKLLQKLNMEDKYHALRNAQFDAILKLEHNREKSKQCETVLQICACAIKYAMFPKDVDAKTLSPDDLELYNAIFTTTSYLEVVKHVLQHNEDALCREHVLNVIEREIHDIEKEIATLLGKNEVLCVHADAIYDQMTKPEVHMSYEEVKAAEEATAQTFAKYELLLTEAQPIIPLSNAAVAMEASKYRLNVVINETCEEEESDPTVLLQDIGLSSEKINIEGKLSGAQKRKADRIVSKMIQKRDVLFGGQELPKEGENDAPALPVPATHVFEYRKLMRERKYELESAVLTARGKDLTKVFLQVMQTKQIDEVTLSSLFAIPEIADYVTFVTNEAHLTGDTKIEAGAVELASILQPALASLITLTLVLMGRNIIRIRSRFWNFVATVTISFLSVNLLLDSKYPFVSDSTSMWSSLMQMSSLKDLPNPLTVSSDTVEIINNCLNLGTFSYIGMSTLSTNYLPLLALLYQGASEIKTGVPSTAITAAQGLMSFASTLSWRAFNYFSFTPDQLFQNGSLIHAKKMFQFFTNSKNGVAMDFLKRYYSMATGQLFSTIAIDTEAKLANVVKVILTTSDSNKQLGVAVNYFVQLAGGFENNVMTYWIWAAQITFMVPVVYGVGVFLLNPPKTKTAMCCLLVPTIVHAVAVLNMESVLQNLAVLPFASLFAPSTWTTAAIVLATNTLVHAIGVMVSSFKYNTEGPGKRLSIEHTNTRNTTANSVMDAIWNMFPALAVEGATVPFSLFAQRQLPTNHVYAVRTIMQNIPCLFFLGTSWTVSSALLMLVGGFGAVNSLSLPSLAISTMMFTMYYGRALTYNVNISPVEMTWFDPVTYARTFKNLGRVMSFHVFAPKVTIQELKTAGGSAVFLHMLEKRLTTMTCGQVLSRDGAHVRSSRLRHIRKRHRQ